MSFVPCWSFAETKPIGDHELSLHFAVRAPGVAEKKYILPLGRSTVSFYDVAGNGDGGASKLIGQAKSF